MLLTRPEQIRIEALKLAIQLNPKAPKEALILTARLFEDFLKG